MCGICGYVQPNSAHTPDLIRQLNQTLYHRGPDGEGYWVNGPAALGMRRLAIIDLAGGNQPIFNETGTLGIVFNGEIFNYRELRADLEQRGHHIRTHSDTETIVHAYEEWGADCPTHLNGQFAFAIWDAAHHRLFLARDHLGLKPLYYTHIGAGVLFGSELKALLAHPECPRELDPVALDQYLALRYIPAPRTIYQHIHKLPAGHSLTWENGQVTVRRYWDVAFRPEPGRTLAEWSAELRPLLADAVQRQMQADVPLGAFLSGGIDSSILVGLMAHHADRPVRTFSIVFPQWPGFDESRYSDLVAQRYATQHQAIRVDVDVARTLPDLVTGFDEPFADPAALPTLLMSRVTRQQVTVALMGEGADELFAGYGWYAWANQRWPVPTAWRAPLYQWAQCAWYGRAGAGQLGARLAPNFATMHFDVAMSSVAPAAVRADLYTAAWRAQHSVRPLTAADFPHLAPLAAAPEQSHMQELDLKLWVEGDPLVKADRMTMAASLEGRVPFLDYRLAELAARIPPDLHRAGGQSKAVLRHAGADLLPPEILTRPKHAFNVPISTWLRHEARPLAESQLLGDGLRRLPMLNPDRIAHYWHAHQRGTHNHARLLWAVLMLALWANR